jgi:hypothetical protein
MHRLFFSDWPGPCPFFRHFSCHFFNGYSSP